jgi:hypothetical protein
MVGTAKQIIAASKTLALLDRFSVQLLQPFALAERQQLVACDVSVQLPTFYCS